MIDRGEIGVVSGLGLLVAAGAVFVGVAVPPPAGVDPQVQLVLAVFVATVVLWITRPVPYSVSSLLCVILLFGLGLVDSFQGAVVGFASTIVFFFILLYLIGASIAKVDLDDWVARRLVSATSTPRSSVRRLSSTILLLSFVMPSGVARTVTFMPVVDQINNLYGLDDDSAFRRFGYYLLGHVNPIMSLVVMTGSGMSVTTAELINGMVRPFTWVEWAIFMTPPVVFLYVISIVVANRIYVVGEAARVEAEPTANGGEPADDATSVEAEDGTMTVTGTGTGAQRDSDAAVTRSDDPLDREQRIVVATLGLAIVAWIVGSFVGVPAIIPAMGVVLVWALPGVGIIDGDDVRDVSWGVVFLMGAMLSLLSVMQDVNALDRLIDAMLLVIPTDGPVVVAVAVLLGVTVLIRGTFSSSSVAIVIMLPILLEFAGALGVEPLFVALGVSLLFNATVFLPFNVPPVLIAQEAGPLGVRQIFLLGVLTLGITGFVVSISWVFYWPLVDGIVGGL